jgi:hypothetical protein
MQTDSSEIVDVGPDKIVHFVDDASGFLDRDPEFAALMPLPAPASMPYWDRTVQPTFVPPTAKAAAAAKKFWLPIIRRYAEPIPGKKGRLRVCAAGECNHGLIVVEDGGCGAFPHTFQRANRPCFSGSEIEVSDKLFLTLFHTEDLAPNSTEAAGAKRIRESIMPVPWTSIVNMRFELNHLEESAAKTGTDG